MNELWLIYGFVFVAAILGIESLYWLVFGMRGTKKAVNRRLALSERLAARSETFDILRQERGVSAYSAFAGLNDFLVQTGVRLSPVGLAVRSLMTGGVVAIAQALLSVSLWIAAIMGLAIGPALVGVYFMRARKKRSSVSPNNFRTPSTSSSAAFALAIRSRPPSTLSRARCRTLSARNSG
jgi:hypothetical protein